MLDGVWDSVLAAAAVAVLCLPLMAMTARGARVRGARALPAALAGLVFPLTWAGWYVADTGLQQRRAEPPSR